MRLLLNLLETTTDRQRVMGASSTIEMDELDELGDPLPGNLKLVLRLVFA